MKFLLSISLFISLSAYSQNKVSILFDHDRHTLRPAELMRLDSLLAFPSFQKQTISITGHTDSAGSIIYNEKLSDRRLNAVRQYLLVKGFPATSIKITKAFGERAPLNNNADAAEMQLNRRVEIIYPAPDRLPDPSVSLTTALTDTAIREGTNIVLRNLNFYGGRHELLPGSVPILKELLAVMIANPTLQIEIHGHICCAAGPEDGLDLDTDTYDLSVNRAREVYHYLIRNGIDADRLSYKGFGHSRPLVMPEDTEEKRVTNRRVEVKVIKR